MALSTICWLMLRPAWSLSSSRHWLDTLMKLARQSRAAGTRTLNT